MMDSQEPTLDSILARKSLSKSILNRKCSDEHLNKMALSITNWRSLSPFIGLTQQEEEDIEDEYKKNFDKKLAMLRTWSRKYGAEATYLKLAEGFESLKRRDLILELLELFLSGSDDSAASTPPSAGAGGGGEVPRGRKKQPIPKLGDKPKPNQLLKLVGKTGKEVYIRDQLAGDWEDLLMHFNFEPTSQTDSLIKKIRKDTAYQVEEACREVLLKWLSGEGLGPVTWETLIGVIEDMGKSELASEIRSEVLPS